MVIDTVDLSLGAPGALVPLYGPAPVVTDVTIWSANGSVIYCADNAAATLAAGGGSVALPVTQTVTFTVRLQKGESLYGAGGNAGVVAVPAK